MAEAKGGKYSELKQHFKRFNTSNENDLQELIQIKKESKTYQFQYAKNAKRKQSVDDIVLPPQPQADIPLNPRSVSTNIIRPKSDQNISKDANTSNNIISQLFPVNNNKQITDQQEKPFNNISGQGGNRNNDFPPSIIPKNDPKTNGKGNSHNGNKYPDKSDKYPPNNEGRQPYDRSNRFPNTRDQNNQKDQNGLNPPQNQQKVEEEVVLINQQGYSFIKILQFNGNVIFIDQNTVFQYISPPPQSQPKEDSSKISTFSFERLFNSTKSSENGKDRLKAIYKLSKKDYKFVNASVHDQILCLQFQDTSQSQGDDEESSYGFVFINFIYSENGEAVEQIKVQQINSIDTKPIRCFQLSMEHEIFMYSTAAGYLFCFGFDLEYKFCYEEPQQQAIDQFLYDDATYSIIYATERGFVSNLQMNEDFTTFNSSPLFKSDKVSNLSFDLIKSQVLVLHDENNQSKASIYTYPDFSLVQTFNTIPASQYSQIYDFAISVDQTFSNDAYFGLLCNNRIAIYRYEMDPTTSHRQIQNLVYEKQLEFSPSCFYFSLELFTVKVIKILYNNPPQIKNDQYASDCYRFILDRFDPNAFS